MTGQTKKCNVYKNRKIVEQYINSFNPYECTPSLGIDLLALTRYAKENGKTPEDLSEAELSKFKIENQRDIP